jgi:hypothetical protein
LADRDYDRMALASGRDHLTRLWEIFLRIKSKIDALLFKLIESISKPIDMTTDYVTRVPSTFWRIVFFGLLFLYTIGLLVQAWSYSGDARLFPFLIGVPLSIMIVLYIGLVLSPRYSSAGGGVFDDITDEALSEADKGLDESGSAELTLRIQRELKMTLWIIGVLVMIYLIGFLNALGIFLFTFLYIYEKSFVRASTITVLSLAFIQVFFVNILTLPLWEGMVFSSFLIAKPQEWK